MRFIISTANVTDREDAVEMINNAKENLEDIKNMYSYEKFEDFIRPNFTVLNKGYTHESYLYDSKYQEKFKKNIEKFHTITNKFREEKITKSPITEFRQLLDGNVIFGEYHPRTAAKNLLIQLAPYLKDHGFTHVFMEHLFYDYQIEIDKLEISKILTSEDPDVIKTGLAGTEQFGRGNEKRWPNNNFLNVFSAMRKAGLRVIALDLQYSYIEQYRYISRYRGDHLLDQGHFRCSSFNFTTCNIIDIESKKFSQAKWCALIGLAHLADIAAFTGARAVAVYGELDSKDSLPKIEYSKTFRTKYRTEDDFADVIIRVDEEKDIPIASLNLTTVEDQVYDQKCDEGPPLLRCAQTSSTFNKGLSWIIAQHQLNTLLSGTIEDYKISCSFFQKAGIKRAELLLQNLNYDMVLSFLKNGELPNIKIYIDNRFFNFFIGPSGFNPNSLRVKLSQSILNNRILLNSEMSDALLATAQKIIEIFEKNQPLSIRFSS